MIKLFKDEEFKLATHLDELSFQCVQCAKAFHREKHEYMKAAAAKDFILVEFCSNNCKVKFDNTTQDYNCRQCNAMFKRRRVEIARTRVGFCCSTCANRYTAAHGKQGMIRSQFEVWTEARLNLDYPNLTIHYNDRTLLKRSELDIFIPSLDIGIEINGPVHYDPIYGDKQLRAVQRNDRRKINKCAEFGINVHSVDTRAMGRFNESEAIKHYQKIKKIIESKYAP